MLKKTDVTRVKECKGYYLIWTKGNSIPKVYKKTHTLDLFLLSL